MPNALGTYLAPGFPGMKATSEMTNTITLPSAPGVAAPLPGCVVVAAANGRQVVPYGTAGAVQAGVCVYDGEYAYQSSAFAQAQIGLTGQIPVNVQRKGPIWGRVSSKTGTTITQGGPAKYDPTDGTFSDQGTITLGQSTFRSGMETGAVLNGFAGDLMVVVEIDTAFVALAGV